MELIIGSLIAAALLLIAQLGALVRSRVQVDPRIRRR